MKRDRRRHVDVNRMNEEDFQRLMEQLGDRLRDLCDQACDEANTLLKPYGLKALMQFKIEPLSIPPSKE